MALISKIVFFITAIILFFGQLLRIQINGTSLPVFNISILLFGVVNFILFFKNKNKKCINKPLFIFLVFTWLSFIYNIFLNHLLSYNSFFYLIRLSVLISFFIFPGYKKDSQTNWFICLSLFANIIFGLIQYFFWPDFTYFNSLNWDPHLYRLVSTFFDPTFTALIYLLFIIYVYLDKNIPFRKVLLPLSYLAMVLTYSRSTYISFLLAFSFISFSLRKPKIFIFSFILIVSTIFLLPRQVGEGTKLERTSSIKAKIENYKEGMQVFKQSPIIGFGYNNLSSVRKINNLESHANNGFDSSLMTILTTTGLIGLILFLYGFSVYFSKVDLQHKTFLIALLAHSLFANSFLYPWVLTLFILF